MSAKKYRKNELIDTECSCGRAWEGHPQPHSITCPAYRALSGEVDTCPCGTGCTVPGGADDVEAARHAAAVHERRNSLSGEVDTDG